ncbi:MAG: hypothetical protein AAF193_06880, partial [Bacteroidota bacterium]
MKKWSYAVLGLVLILALGIGPKLFEGDPTVEMNKNIPNLPYDFVHPDRELKLEKALKEISGLTYFQKGQLAGIQDEDGFVFIIDEQTG